MDIEKEFLLLTGKPCNVQGNPSMGHSADVTILLNPSQIKAIVTGKVYLINGNDILQAGSNYYNELKIKEIKK